MLLVPTSSHPVAIVKVASHASVLVAVESTVPPERATAVILVHLGATDRILIVRAKLSNDASIVAHKDIRLLDHLKSNPERFLVSMEDVVAKKVAFPFAIHLADSQKTCETRLLVDKDDS
jgi:hypothetical protein